MLGQVLAKSKLPKIAVPQTKISFVSSLQPRLRNKLQRAVSLKVKFFDFVQIVQCQIISLDDIVF